MSWHIQIKKIGLTSYMYILARFNFAETWLRTVKLPLHKYCDIALNVSW